MFYLCLLEKKQISSFLFCFYLAGWDYLQQYTKQTVSTAAEH